eukprot:scaffold6.g2911.t1
MLRGARAARESGQARHPGTARVEVNAEGAADHQAGPSHTSSEAAGGSLPATPARCSLSEQLVAVSTRLLLTQPHWKADDAGLPLGAVVTPGLPARPGSEDEPAPALPTLLGEPPACAGCGARQNCYSPRSADTGEWRCNFCLHLNPGGPGGAAGAGAAVEAVDWVMPTPAGGPAGGAGLLALLLDVEAEQEALDVAKAAAAQALYGLHSSTRVALLAFASHSVAAYRLGAGPRPLSPRQEVAEAEAPLVEADVLPGEAYLTDDVLSVLRPGLHALPLRECRKQLAAAIGTLRSHAPPASGVGSSSSGVRRPRSLGTALEAALHLALESQERPAAGGASQQQHPQQQEMRRRGEGGARAHVVVVTTGPAAGYATAPELQLTAKALGEGDEPPEAYSAYIEDVAQARRAWNAFDICCCWGVAAEQGVTLDIVAAADSGGCQLAPLAQATGGIFALHALRPGPSNGRASGGASGGGLSDSGGFAASVAAAIARPAGLGCVMEVFTSSGLAVTEAYGAGEFSWVPRRWQAAAALEAVAPGTSATAGVSDSRRMWFAYPACRSGGRQEPPAHWSNRRLSVYRTGLPDANTGVTLLLHCDKPPKQQHAFLQAGLAQTGWPCCCGYSRCGCSMLALRGHRVPCIRCPILATRWLPLLFPPALTLPQVCCRWGDPDGSSTNPAAALEALDPLVGAVVWSKRVINSALEQGAAANRREAEILRRQLGQQFSEFAAANLLPDERSRGWFSGPSRFLLPPSFLSLAAALHQLVRGPLLNHGVLPSADARELAQAHFMTAGLTQCRLTLQPQLHLLWPNAEQAAGHAAAGQVEAGEGSSPASADRSSSPAADAANARGSGAFASPVPATDVLLLPGTAAVADAGSSILVWLGEGTTQHQQEQCTALAQSLAAGRMPAPEIAVVPAGSPQEAQRLWPHLMLLAGAPGWLQHEALPLLDLLPREAVRQAAAAAVARLEDGGPGASKSLLAWLQGLGILPLRRHPGFFSTFVLERNRERARTDAIVDAFCLLAMPLAVARAYPELDTPAIVGVMAYWLCIVAGRADQIGQTLAAWQTALAAGNASCPEHQSHACPGAHFRLMPARTRLAVARWRSSHFDAYCCWRQWPTAVLHTAPFIFDICARVFEALAQRGDTWSQGSGLAQALGLAFTLGFFSDAAVLVIMGMARQTTLPLNTVMQVIAVASVTRHNTAICSTPLFVCPRARHHMQLVYNWLGYLNVMVPLPLAVLEPGTPLSRCRCVFAMLQLVLGLAVPLGWAAIRESRTYARAWDAHRAGEVAYGRGDQAEQENWRGPMYRRIDAWAGVCREHPGAAGLAGAIAAGLAWGVVVALEHHGWHAGSCARASPPVYG